MPPSRSVLSADRLRAFVQEAWDARIVPILTEYVRMPAKSPAFDEAWQAHGHLDRAVELAAGWARQRPVEGLRVEVVRLPGRTPVLLMEVPGHADETVLLYGHLDKQPEMTGWSERLGPWTPVRRRDRLYGRGAADDGYAAFAALSAIEANLGSPKPVSCLPSRAAGSRAGASAGWPESSALRVGPARARAARAAGAGRTADDVAETPGRVAGRAGEPRPRGRWVRRRVTGR